MKSKLQSAVLGISGGIDSTVVAAILYEVNKKIHKIDPDYIFCFFGYSLPTKTTYDGEYLVSTFVGNAFANHFETVNVICRKIYNIIKQFTIIVIKTVCIHIFIF